MNLSNYFPAPAPRREAELPPLIVRVLIPLLSLMAAALPALAEDKPLPENAQRLKLAYGQAVEHNTAPLRTQYDAQMNRLLQTYMQAGKIDEVMALKAELAHDPQAQADQAKLPPEARQLKALLQKSTLAAIASVRRSYVTELSKVMAESTRANRLDEALAIREEIKSVPVAPAEPPPASSLGGTSINAPPSKSLIALTNSTKAHEADVVLAAAEARNPDIFRSTKELELISFHDIAEDPMKHDNGDAEHVPGEHAKKVWVSSKDGMIVWGPYDKLEPGSYFVVYRVRFYDKAATGEVAFLDVAQGGSTQSGLRPKAAEVPPGTWQEIAVPLKVTDAKDYEFRLWGSGKKMAMDRVYVFKVKAGK